MSTSRTPAKHFAPLAIGAPDPFRQLPVRLERMIHFVPPHNDKIRARLKDLIGQVDVVLGNLEDAIPSDAKVAARQGFIAMANANDFGQTGLWTRINALNSPWGLDDILEIVPAAGAKLDVIMLPKVEGPWDIHYLDQLLAQLEAKHALPKPIQSFRRRYSYHEGASMIRVTLVLLAAAGFWTIDFVPASARGAGEERSGGAGVDVVPARVDARQHQHLVLERRQRFENRRELERASLALRRPVLHGHAVGHVEGEEPVRRPRGRPRA